MAITGDRPCWSDRNTNARNGTRCIWKSKPFIDVSTVPGCEAEPSGGEQRQGIMHTVPSNRHIDRSVHTGPLYAASRRRKINFTRYLPASKDERSKYRQADANLRSSIVLQRDCARSRTRHVETSKRSKRNNVRGVGWRSPASEGIAIPLGISGKRAAMTRDQDCSSL